MPLTALKTFRTLLIDAFRELKKNDPLRMAGATAFFTTFALPPILIILIQLFGHLFRIENLGDEFFIRLADILGKESTAQIKRTFIGFQALAKNRYITIGGILFLVFVATTLFKVIKDSLNQLWKIRVDPKEKLVHKFESRFTALLVILLAGILFLGGTFIEGLQDFLRHNFSEFSTLTGWYINVTIGKVLSAFIATIWFAVLFKYLPDGKPSWKVAINGALFTAVLFTIGKMLIRYMLMLGNLHTVFGTSSSIVLLLLFVFYCSFILYYGACFTKVYAKHIRQPIRAGVFAFEYEVVEVKKKEEAVAPTAPANASSK